LSIVRGNIDDFQRTWDETEASAGFDPLPPGVYRCLITRGELFTSRTNATPGYKVEFEIVAGQSAGRKVWFDCWLSRAALGIAKAELAKLGITRPGQLEQPLPPDLIADVQVVQRTDDNGTVWNRVRSFQIVDDVPDDDDGLLADSIDDDAPEVDGEHFDAAGFDWRTGVQVEPKSATPLLDKPNGRTRR
jgi:hypothetical protein